MTFMSPLEESAALAKIARALAEIHGQALEPKHIMEAIARVRGLRSSPDVAMRIEDMVDNLLTEVWNDWDEKQAMRAAPGTHTTMRSSVRLHPEPEPITREQVTQNAVQLRRMEES